MTKVLRNMAWVLVLAGLVWQGQALAQSKAKMNVTDADRQFVLDAATGGMSEVEMGKAAKHKAVTKDVKMFGERMARDHHKINTELTHVAEKCGVTMPIEVTSEQKMMLDKLNSLNGMEFDRMYMQSMVDDHKKDVDAFRKASQDATDPGVRKFAQKNLPTLEDHLKSAQMINDRLKANQAATR